MTETEISQRGLDALRVLENPAYRQAMDGLKAQVIQQWKDCPIRDKEGQLLLLQLAKLTDKFDALLTEMVEAGEFAQKKIDLNEIRNESPLRKAMRRVI